MKRRALVLALALAACGPTADKAKAPEAAAPDPFKLNIEIGRYRVMLSQVHALSADRPGAAQGEVTDPRDLARRLRETVWEYNLERSSLCGRGLFTNVTCAPAYQPVWIGENADSAPSVGGTGRAQPRCRGRSAALLECGVRRCSFARGGRAGATVCVRDGVAIRSTMYYIRYKNG